ncbi:hypothetical protein [Lacipirellula parvula]|uniref:Uncharacterized protein n=1 Tax=Lacipirellula parvula TaxID=2650471 RepID=A0A5K7XGM4_9BACT|nr:hypothetical protein [Lacipirellula parvula]BBO34071.1 hypothetical protein PLANPX_3683 [Lacipirellula parvula]
MNDNEAAWWSATRAKGQKRYVISRSVLFCGVAMVLVAVMDFLGWQQQPSDWIWYLIGFLVGGYLFSVWTWKGSEQQYRAWQTSRLPTPTSAPTKPAASVRQPTTQSGSPATIPPSVTDLLQTPSEAHVAALLDDDDAIFLVDWREEDDVIIEYCESILRTGSLSAAIIDVDADPGFELYIEYSGKRSKVPLVVGHEDRHITLYSLNQALAPDYEIRVCVDSQGSDTLAFLPLRSAHWSTLEQTYGRLVDKHFRKITQQPNLFTDRW